jgi:hypothetical protein
MKTMIKSAIAATAVCLLAGCESSGLPQHESTVSPGYYVSAQTTGLPANDEASARLTEQLMERLPEISTH